jgi:single-strand DNA-binding protein
MKYAANSLINSKKGEYMSKGVNKVILIGHLGNDPDMRATPSGVSVTTVSVATNESWVDKQSGQRQERTEWHRVVFFDRLAEIVKQYLRKGSQIYVEGRLQTRKWQDQNNNNIERYTTEIIARDMQMLDSRNDSGGANYGAPGAYGTSSGGYAPAYNQPATGQAPQAPSYPNQNAAQPIPPQPPVTNTNTAPQTTNDKDFDQDVPF